MSAYFFSSFFQFPVNGVFVFLHQRFLHIFRYRTVSIQILVVGHIIGVHLCRSQTIFFNRIFTCKTVGSYQLIHTAVWTGSHDIMLYQHCLPVFRTDNRSRLISVLEIFHFLARCFLNIFRTVYSFRIHRYQILHPVAPVNIQQLTSRTHSMSSIYITPVFPVVIHTPVVPVIRPEIFQIMDIGTLHM